MPPNLDVTSTTINIILMFLILGAAFFILKGKKEKK